MRLTGQYFFNKYYKRIKRKVKTPKLTFTKTDTQIKTPKVTYSLYNMHK